MGLYMEKIFGFIQYLVNFVTNIFIKPKKEYEQSAMVYNVVWSLSKVTDAASRKSFIVLFEKFEHPSILLEDKYTLYSVSDSEAIFVDCGGKDVCLLYTSPSPRDGLLSRMPSSA